MIMALVSAIMHLYNFKKNCFCPFVFDIFVWIKGVQSTVCIETVGATGVASDVEKSKIETVGATGVASDVEKSKINEWKSMMHENVST